MNFFFLLEEAVANRKRNPEMMVWTATLFIPFYPIDIAMAAKPVPDSVSNPLSIPVDFVVIDIPKHRRRRGYLFLLVATVSLFL